MNNLKNKPKRSSKLKHPINNDRFAYNSPAKFATKTSLSSGCCPKNPPNISFHYLEKRKLQVKGQYYVSGKQNKGRIMNNYVELKQCPSHLDTTDRLKQKRNTHYFTNHQTHKLLQVRKSNQPNENNQKTIHKSKFTRDPIPLGTMKSQKSKMMRQTDKQNKNQKYIKRQFKQKSIYIPEDLQCHEKCFQNLSAYSIAHSKASSIYPQMTNFQQSRHLIDKQKLIQSRKNNGKTGFHRSPKIMSPVAPLKIPQKTPEQEIAEFQIKINEINTNFQHQSLAYMQTKDFQYVQSKNLNCYLGNQKHLDWKKRAVVINWMVQVLAQIGGKRQTLANGVNIFDRYLSCSSNIPLDYVQCTAVASLLIAAKLQDKSLSASYLSETTMHKYTTDQINQQEFKIFCRLDFKVNTPTLNSWANRLAVQWDIYLENVDLRHFDIIFSNLKSLKFKNSDQTSYYNYRWLCQYIDFSIMDIFTLRYQPRMLSLAFIYIILALRLNLYTKEQVVSVFPYSSQFLLQKSEFHDFFSIFLKDSFSQELIDLLPMIQYCSTFVILPLRFQLPEAVPQSTMQNEKEEINYQNFCSFQTKNQNTLVSLYKRNRNVF